MKITFNPIMRRAKPFGYVNTRTMVYGVVALWGFGRQLLITWPL